MSPPRRQRPGPQSILVVVLALIGGCTSVTVRDVKPDAPTLPALVSDPVPIRVGVVFPEALREARIETTYHILQARQSWRHDIGDALVAGLRQVLAASFAGVVELPGLPTPGTVAPGVDAVLVPGLPSMSAVAPPDSVVWLYRQSLRLPVAIHAPDGERRAEWTVDGIAATGAYGPLLTRQKALDEALLRSTVAAFVASLHREPARSALRTPVAVEPASDMPVPAREGTVVLRLDAGLAKDDGIEGRVAGCIGSAFAPPPGQPAHGQPAAALRDALFPWFDPAVAPREPDQIRSVLAMPAVRDRLQAMGVGRLVLLTARDGERVDDDALACLAGFNAAMCFGRYSQRNGYVVDLSVWDVGASGPRAAGSASFSRTIGVLGVVVPIPYTYANADAFCEALKAVVREADAGEVQRP